MESVSEKKPNILTTKKLPDSPGVYFFLGPPKPLAKETLGPPKSRTKATSDLLKQGKDDLDEARLRSGEFRCDESDSACEKLRRDEGEILYIGKATSLRDRVRSYFTQDLMVTRGPKLQLMIERATDIKWRTTDSVLEALLLESYLIKKHQPPYNTDEKDDKSYNYVVITKEKFPRVLLMRGKDLSEQGSVIPAKAGIQVNTSVDSRLRGNDKTKDVFKVKYSFGPFPQGGMLREAMKIVRRIFPFRDKCLPAESSAKEGLPFETQENAYDTKKLERELSSNPVFSKENNKVKKKVTLSGAPKSYPCFDYQIGLCPGVCVGKITSQEYAKTIRNIKMFFEGKKGRLVRRLENEMHEAAKRLEFEKANEMKRTLFALGHIKDVSLLKKDFLETNKENGMDHIHASPQASFRIEAYDAAHLSGKDVVGVMTVVENDKVNKAEYRQFKIRGGSNNDLASLEQMLSRRLAHREWRLPSLIVVDGFELQLNTARKVLDDFGLAIPLVSVVKDERHKAREILGDQAYAQKHHDAILLANSEAHRFAITFHRKRRSKSFLPSKRIGF